MKNSYFLFLCWVLAFAKQLLPLPMLGSCLCQTVTSFSYGTWLGGAMVLGKLPVPGRPSNFADSRARAYCACSGCGWGLFGHFTLTYLFSPLSPSLRMTARYRLKYCLKGPLNQKQPTTFSYAGFLPVPNSYFLFLCWVLFSAKQLLPLPVLGSCLCKTVTSFTYAGFLPLQNSYFLYLCWVLLSAKQLLPFPMLGSCLCKTVSSFTYAGYLPLQNSYFPYLC